MQNMKARAAVAVVQMMRCSNNFKIKIHLLLLMYFIFCYFLSLCVIQNSQVLNTCTSFLLVQMICKSCMYFMGSTEYWKYMSASAANC